MSWSSRLEKRTPLLSSIPAALQSRLLLLDFVEEHIDLKHQIAQLLGVRFRCNQLRQSSHGLGHGRVECHGVTFAAFGE